LIYPILGGMVLNKYDDDQKFIRYKYGYYSFNSLIVLIALNYIFGQFFNFQWGATKELEIIILIGITALCFINICVYKNAYFLIKDRLFALTQCLKQLDMSNIEIENLLVELYNDFELPISVPDISFLANTKKYNYSLDKLSEKIKYNFVRSKDFNYYNLK